MKRNVFIAGFPEAGKTTFLASLFHTLDEKRKHRQGYFVELPSDITYINRIRDQWALAVPLERTKTQIVESLHFKIAKDDSVALDLSVPDISGELFRSILKDRKLEKVISEKISAADIILIFIHPEKITGTRRLDNILADTGASPAQSSDQSTEEAFDYLESPTQVLVVDLIQSFLKLKQSARIGLIVSAWDLLAKAHSSPEEYVKQNLPLLSQFLENSGPNVIFALSANGGDIHHDKERLQNLEPSERVSLRLGEQTHQGYDYLIDWLINERR